VNRLLSKIIPDKKGSKAMEARAAALPLDYRIVYNEIKSYTWKLAGSDGTATVAILDQILGTFEAGAVQTRIAFDVTGPDVAAFCAARLRDTAPHAASDTDKWRASLNRDIADKLAH
jgi:DNA-binding ferritin-like protein (Dps family)